MESIRSNQPHNTLQDDIKFFCYRAKNKAITKIFTSSIHAIETYDYMIRIDKFYEDLEKRQIRNESRKRSHSI